MKDIAHGMGVPKLTIYQSELSALTVIPEIRITTTGNGVLEDLF